MLSENIHVLIIEKSKGNKRYYVSNYEKNVCVEEMLKIVHMRWRIEQGYAELKEELGFDHYEGRSWQGLHHHIAVSFMAYCFLELIRNKKIKRIKKTKVTLRSHILGSVSMKCSPFISVRYVSV